MPIFAIPLRKNGIALSLKNNFAEIAQLVEHNLAKVGVASSSLVFRSTEVIRNDGLFSYISMGYAASARLCRYSGRILTLQQTFGKSGEKRAVSGEMFYTMFNTGKQYL